LLFKFNSCRYTEEVEAMEQRNATLESTNAVGRYKLNAVYPP
jgi:hypothetical protein